MARAAEMKNGALIHRPNYSVPVMATYKDAEDNWHRTKATLEYIPSQNCLRFCGLSYENCGDRPQDIVIPPGAMQPKSLAPSFHESASPSDEQTLQSLQIALPSSSIAELRAQQFAGAFLWNIDAALIAFQQWALLPEHRFLDYSLEQIHERLRERVAALYDKVHRYTEDMPGQLGSKGFWPLGEIGDMDAYNGRRNETYEAAKAVCAAYDDLILAARRKSAGVVAPPQERVSRPKVVATKYGDLPNGVEGLHLHNEGDVAHEVRVEDVRLGEWVVRFDDGLPLLKSDYLPIKSILKVTHLEGGEHLDTVGSLDYAWRDAQKVEGLIERLPLRIFYRDFDGNPFQATCSIERDVLVRGDAPFRIVGCRDEVVETLRPLRGTYST